MRMDDGLRRSPASGEAAFAWASEGKSCPHLPRHGYPSLKADEGSPRLRLVGEKEKKSKKKKEEKKFRKLKK